MLEISHSLRNTLCNEGLLAILQLIFSVLPPNKVSRLVLNLSHHFAACVSCPFGIAIALMGTVLL